MMTFRPQTNSSAVTQRQAPPALPRTTTSFPARLSYGTAPLQRATTIQYGPLKNFTYRWGPNPTDQKSGNVATKMHAELDPNDVKTGTNTTGTDAFSDLFSALKTHSKTSNWVRAHLLNHDLGGKAVYNNLFPMTTAANGEHKYEVEYPIKHWVAQGCEVTYDVNAHQDNPTAGSSDGAFVCSASVTSDPLGAGLAGDRIQKVIYSHGTGTANTTRTYNASTQAMTGEAGVQHGSGNNVARDKYNLTQSSAWNHAVGDSTTNNITAASTALADIDTSGWGNTSTDNIRSRSYGASFGHGQFQAFIS